MAARDWESPDPGAAQRGVAAWLLLSHLERERIKLDILDQAWMASLLPSHEVVQCKATGRYCLSLGNAYYCGLAWPLEVKTMAGRRLLVLQLEAQPQEALAQQCTCM
jgi:hypothetical protein